MSIHDKVSAVLEATPKGLLINGEWRDASDGGTLDAVSYTHLTLPTNREG